MPLPIWIPDALHFEQLSVDQTYWRCVEAQHVVAVRCSLFSILSY